jgi:hypothetical protein
MGLLPTEAGEPPPFWRPSVLEGVAREAGLEPQETFTTGWAFEFPDERTAVETLLSVAAAVAAVGLVGHDPVAEAVRGAIRPCRREDGSYSLPNEWRFLRCDRR